MAVFRWVLAGLITLHALWTLLPPILMTAYKMGVSFAPLRRPGLNVLDDYGPEALGIEAVRRRG